ncbi:MAG: VWA domain-containing protein [bacterium]|nr:VWA domain-containing protein [bacterium]
MEFEHPHALYLLVLLIVFVLAAVYNFKKKKKILNDFVSSTAYEKLGLRSGGEIDFFKTGLVTLALAFFILALAGPQWGSEYETMDVKGIEMVFLLDTSTSMRAEDLKPNRLEVAKQFIVSTVDTLTTDYVSLLNFAGVAYVQCPLTIDYEAFKLMAEASVISPKEEQGTDFERAFVLALKTFEKSKSNEKVLVLITDGEDQEKTWEKAVPLLTEQKIKVFAVGVGVASGALIPEKNENGEVVGWKKDKQGEIVKTKLDENALVQLAHRTGGQYFRLTDAAAGDSILNVLKNFERNVLSNKVKETKIKRYYFPLLIGIMLLILELFLSEKRLSWKKD